MVRRQLEPKHHFLPKCYQRGFADSSGRVWVKFAGNPTPEHRNPASVGWHRGLYAKFNNGKEIETFFSREVENDYGALLKRIKNQNAMPEVSGDELAALSRFVACQTVRTSAHEQCITEQAGRPVDKSTFNRVMMRKISAMMGAWWKTFPTFQFHTPLPFVGELFITGDHPVLVIQVKDDPIWVPTNNAITQIMDLEKILQNKNSGLWLALTPYFCVSIHNQEGGEPRIPTRTMEPSVVRQFNEMVRGQCKIFTLARDKDCLV